MKKLVFSLFHGVGLTRLASWLHRDSVVILCYHGVTGRNGKSDKDPQGLHIRAERFEAQVNYLKRHFNIISLRDYLSARREGRRLPRKSVVLTFDDGYRNFLTMVAPRLLKLSVPVSVFLTTNEIAQANGNDAAATWQSSDDEKYLSWAEVKQLQNLGIEFGSHTCSHPDLATLPESEAERELRESQTSIVAALQTQPLPFAYPYGAYNQSLIEKTRACGYTCALTTDAGVNDADTDLYALRRTLIGDDDNVPAFAARVAGITSWFSSASRPTS